MSACRLMKIECQRIIWQDQLDLPVTVGEYLSWKSVRSAWHFLRVAVQFGPSGRSCVSLVIALMDSSCPFSAKSLGVLSYEGGLVRVVD